MKAKKHYFCLRCGMQKKKGYTDAGCHTGYAGFKKHMWILTDEKGLVTV